MAFITARWPGSSRQTSCSWGQHGSPYSLGAQPESSLAVHLHPSSAAFFSLQDFSGSQVLWLMALFTDLFSTGQNSVGGFTVYCCDPNVFHRASTQQMLRKQGGEAFLTHVTSLELLQHLSQTKGDGSLRNGALGTTFKFSLSHLLADLGICNSVYP